MSVASVSAAVQVRVSPDRLKQLTNYDPVATTINTAVLEAACSDAIGEFENISGLEHDTDIPTHTTILVKGVQYLLETYKGRDSNMITVMQRSFQMDCLKLRERLYISPETTSQIEITEASRRRDSSLDFDRNSTIWPENRQAITPREVSGE